MARTGSATTPGEPRRRRRRPQRTNLNRAGRGPGEDGPQGAGCVAIAIRRLVRCQCGRHRRVMSIKKAVTQLASVQGEMQRATLTLGKSSDTSVGGAGQLCNRGGGLSRAVRRITCARRRPAPVPLHGFMGVGSSGSWRVGSFGHDTTNQPAVSMRWHTASGLARPSLRNKRVEMAGPRLGPVPSQSQISATLGFSFSFFFC